MADNTWSMQRRLKRQLLSWIGGVWVAGMVAAMYGLWHESTEILDSALLEMAQAVLALPEATLSQPGGSPPGFAAHDEHIVYQILDAGGRLRLRSHAAPATAMDADRRDGVRQVGGWHVLTLNLADGSRYAQVAETRAHRFEVMWASAIWLCVALLAVLALSALLIDLLLRRSFAALEPGRRELSQRLPHDLRPLQADGLPQEMQPWLASVNSLMARVHAMLAAERAFAAHTAHELRTPLAAARAQAQRLVQSSATTAQADKAQALVRQLDRITALAARLLQLARIESGVALRRETFDLVEMAQMVVAEFADARHGGRVHVHASVDQLHVQGDIDALGIALRNLVDNALKHGGESGPVAVHVDVDAITVVDVGPGVSAEVLPRLGGKFERGASDREGAGLGLAMVMTIARQSNVRVELRSPVEDGHGFSATLRFVVPPATNAGSD